MQPNDLRSRYLSNHIISDNNKKRPIDDDLSFFRVSVVMSYNDNNNNNNNNPFATTTTTTTTTATTGTATTTTTTIHGYRGNPNLRAEIVAPRPASAPPPFVTFSNLPPGQPVIRTAPPDPTKAKGKAAMTGHAKMVGKVREHLLRELNLFLGKMGDPWYRFARQYAGRMGGNVTVDDLIGSYPYDFYNAGLWDERKKLGTGFYGLEEQMEEADAATKRYIDSVEREGDRVSLGTQLESAVDRLVTEVKLSESR